MVVFRQWALCLSKVRNLRRKVVFFCPVVNWSCTFLEDASLWVLDWDVRPARVAWKLDLLTAQLRWREQERRNLLGFEPKDTVLVLASGKFGLHFLKVIIERLLSLYKLEVTVGNGRARNQLVGSAAGRNVVDQGKCVPGKGSVMSMLLASQARLGPEMLRPHWESAGTDVDLLNRRNLLRADPKDVYRYLLVALGCLARLLRLSRFAHGLADVLRQMLLFTDDLELFLEVGQVLLLAGCLHRLVECIFFSIFVQQFLLLYLVSCTELVFMALKWLTVAVLRTIGFSCVVGGVVIFSVLVELVLWRCYFTIFIHSLSKRRHLETDADIV